MRLFAVAKEVDPFLVGDFFWNWLLDSGAGYVILTGKAVRPLYYRYKGDEEGNSPRENHGFFVTEEKAKIMSVVVKGLVFNEKDKWMELEKECDEREKRAIENDVLRTVYNMPVRKNFIEHAEEFVSFAEESGGFYIGQTKEARNFESFVFDALQDELYDCEGITLDTVQVKLTKEECMIDGKHWRTHLEERAKEEEYKIVFENRDGEYVNIRKMDDK